MAKTKAEIQREYAKRSGYAAQKKYAAKFKKQYSLPCFTATEADIIKKLDSVPNKAGYIKGLIRADIERENK